VLESNPPRAGAQHPTCLGGCGVSWETWPGVGGRCRPVRSRPILIHRARIAGAERRCMDSAHRIRPDHTELREPDPQHQAHQVVTLRCRAPLHLLAALILDGVGLVWLLLYPLSVTTIVPEPSSGGAMSLLLHSQSSHAASDLVKNIALSPTSGWWCET
jgi:hypothetical protein